MVNRNYCRECLIPTGFRRWAGDGHALEFLRVTAVTLGALKKRLNPKSHELGVYILGGKGKQAYGAKRQIERVAGQHSLDGKQLVKSARMTGRIDNNAVQDGFDLYQQYFLLTDEGSGPHLPGYE